MFVLALWLHMKGTPQATSEGSEQACDTICTAVQVSQHISKIPDVMLLALQDVRRVVRGKCCRGAASPSQQDHSQRMGEDLPVVGGGQAFSGALQRWKPGPGDCGVWQSSGSNRFAARSIHQRLGQW